MALDPVIMAKQAAKFLNLLSDSHVFKLGTNQDYEGDVAYTNQLEILTEPEVTTTSYTRDGTITYVRPTPGKQYMVVDQRQVFALKEDDLEKKLASTAGTKMWERTMKRGAWQLADDVDDFIRDLMYNGTMSSNILTNRTIGLGMNASAYETIVDLVKAVKKQNVPNSELHVFIDPDFEGFLTKDGRFTGHNTAEARKTIRGMAIGQVEFADVHVTNNTYRSGSTYRIQLAWEGSTTYAEQMRDMRHIPVTAGDFDERVDSQLVFGGKVTQPQGLAYVDVQYAA